MITVGWEQDEEAFIIRENGTFVGDYFDPRDALKECIAIVNARVDENRFEVIAENMGT